MQEFYNQTIASWQWSRNEVEKRLVDLEDGKKKVVDASSNDVTDEYSEQLRKHLEYIDSQIARVEAKLNA